MCIRDRDEMQRKLAVFVHHGMPRVVAALIPADHIILAGDQIDHPPLAFVAPVDAYDRTVAHIQNSFITFILYYTINAEKMHGQSAPFSDAV